jgi:thioredoxin 1
LPQRAQPQRVELDKAGVVAVAVGQRTLLEVTAVGKSGSNMTVSHDYLASEPRRAEIDQLPGPTLLEFGSPWCGYCRRAQPLIDEAFATHPGVRHVKIADASRRRLGRSFGVKLWPTLVFLKDGKEIARLVRPMDVEPIRKAIDEIDPSATS